MLRTRLHADPAGVFLHDAILDACHRFAERTALVDASLDPPRRITYAEYGELVERLARGFVAAGGDRGGAARAPGGGRLRRDQPPG